MVVAFLEIGRQSLEAGYSKHGLENDWESKKLIHSYGVSFWKGIMQLIDEFKVNVRMKVGSGMKINFWKDIWYSECALKYEAPNMFRLARD